FLFSGRQFRVSSAIATSPSCYLSVLQEKELGACGSFGAVVEMKRRNLNWGSPRIAQQIALAFGVAIDKDVVRRILSVHYWPDSGSQGLSWLTFVGHTKDSLWSCDLFRCESQP